MWPLDEGIDQYLRTISSCSRAHGVAATWRRRPHDGNQYLSTIDTARYKADDGTLQHAVRRFHRDEFSLVVDLQF